MMDEAGRVFYARLFELHPELRKLFRSDVQDQARALMAMLELIVKNLDLHDKLVPLIHYLDERHMALNVRPEHYRPFGEALMWTLNRMLGDELPAKKYSACVMAEIFFNVSSSRRTRIDQPS